MHEATTGECTLCDRSCRYFIQNDFFCRLAGPVAPTGKAIVHWIGCINAIKTKVSFGLCSRNASKNCHYSGKDECNSGLLQQIVFSSKSKEKIETSDRFECIKHASIGPNIQDGDVRGHQELHLQRGMGSLGRPHRCVLPYSHSSKVAKPSVLSCRRTFFLIQSPTFRYSDGSTRINPHCQRGKVNAARQGYTHSPVLRRLATASSNTADLHGAVKTTGRVFPGTH